MRSRSSLSDSICLFVARPFRSFVTFKPSNRFSAASTIPEPTCAPTRGQAVPTRSLNRKQQRIHELKLSDKKVRPDPVLFPKWETRNRIDIFILVNINKL